MGQSRPNFSLLSRAGRLYVGIVSLAGLVVFSHSVWVVTTTDIDWHWIVFAALTVLGGAITIKVPSLLALLSVTEMFAFTCVLLFGPAAYKVFYPTVSHRRPAHFRLDSGPYDLQWKAQSN